MEAFDVADQYRTPVMVVGDGMIGQMMEPVEFKEPKEENYLQKLGQLMELKGRENHNVINSLYLDPQAIRRSQL